MAGPTLSGRDGALKNQHRGFTLDFTASHTQANMALRAQAALDGTKIFERAGLSAPAAFSVSVADAAVAAMTPGTVHTLTVEAADTAGAKAVRRHTFKAMEDLQKDCVYYILRDGVPIARLTNAQRYIDYSAVGRHRYRVRGVDRYGSFADSNEVEVETALDCATLAPLDGPQEPVTLYYRIGEPPLLGQTLRVPHKHFYFEGRSYAAVQDGGAREEAFTAAYSVPTMEEYQKVHALCESGAPALYRDAGSGAAAVSIDTLEARFLEGHIDFTLKMTRLAQEQEVEYD